MNAKIFSKSLFANNVSLKYKDLPAREASPVPDSNIMAPALARSGSIAKAGNNLRLIEKKMTIIDTDHLTLL